MDSQLRDKILISIKALENVNIEEIIADVFKDRSSFENEILQTMSVGEFVSFFKRVLMQLKDELENGYWIILPDQFNFNNEFGGGTLSQTLAALATELNLKSLEGLKVSEQYIKTIGYYEVVNGFFDKSERNIHSLRGLRVEETETKQRLLTEQLEKNIKFRESLFVTLEERINQLEEFTTQK